MGLSYKNLSCNHFLKQIRNINYANAALLFGFQNKLDVNVNLTVDLAQLILQADIFANEMLSNNSSLNFKRFLGSYSRDWPRLLHEAYIYDHCRCLFYGINGGRINNLSDSCYCFPGHLLLTKMLHNPTFSYNINDEQPYNVFVNLNYSNDFSEYLNKVFDMYPKLNQGMSSSVQTPHYYNHEYEAILKGLYLGREYLATRTQNPIKDLFEMVVLSEETANTWINRDSNPIINSYLNNAGDKFFFILPTEVSNSKSFRSNESLFVSRAIGIRNDSSLTHLGNTLNTIAPRRFLDDRFTKEEVYAVTGLRSEIEPKDCAHIYDYLSVFFDVIVSDAARKENFLGMFREEKDKS
jgi:hypothetical protein